MRYEFDPEDIGLLVVGFIAASSMAGIATWTIFDVSLGDAAIKAADYGFLSEPITLAWLLSAGAFAGTVVTNDNADWQSLHKKGTYQRFDNAQVYWGAVVGALALLVAWPLVSDVSSFVQSSDLWGLLYLGIVLTAQGVTGWLL